MARRNRRSKAKARTVKESRTVRASTKQVSTAAIEMVRKAVDRMREVELSPRYRYYTFTQMLLDDAVFACFDTNSAIVEKAFLTYEIDYNKESEESKAAADFLKFNLNNLKGQTLSALARNAIEFKKDGFAAFEKVYEKSYGEWETYNGKPLRKLKKLSYIHPLTLHKHDAFFVPDGGDEISELRQDISAFVGTDHWNTKFRRYQGKDYVPISMKKVALFTYSATQTQPLGRSPFEAAYTAWREKVLLQEYTLVGVTKDFSGTPVLKVPSLILDEANANPDSDAARMVEDLKFGMSNMNAGEQAFIILPSDPFNETGSGQSQYEMSFQGIQGGNKNFNIVELVEQRKKAIYNVFGAASLIAGESSGGYNQLDGQLTIHSYFTSRDISVIEEVLNKVVRELFAFNEWELSDEDLPKLKAGDVNTPTLDEQGKFIQRVGTSGYLPVVPAVINHILDRAGIAYRVPDDMSTEELRKILSENTSNAGEGAGTSGTGNTQAASGGDGNMDNTA